VPLCQLVIGRCLFSGNQARGSSFRAATQVNSWGGGLFTSVRPLIIMDTQFFNNSAFANGSSDSQAYGGGAHFDGATDTNKLQGQTYFKV
jgi:hypothetical protein